MLTVWTKGFIAYCKTAGFKDKSIESLSIRLNEFKKFLKTQRLRKISSIRYDHLSCFVADFGNPSSHVKKSRVWMLRKLFHYLFLENVVADNIAMGIRYPKIDNTLPRFLTVAEYNRILAWCAKRASSHIGARDLIIVLMLGVLGLRTGALVKLNTQDVDIEAGLLWVAEKGNLKRNMVLPAVLCEIVKPYLEPMTRGPLFLSKRGRRVSARTLQEVFSTAAKGAGVEKHLHAHLFRHTAGTQLNRVGGLSATQYLLGHAKHYSTVKYAHLNPDKYMLYMRRHPYMKGGDA